ncbi:MAG: ABC transporter ATP-binding protein, partial [Eggerthellaceae bacterium]|nr:ABC transporter ATP-binding protein [Eggerthellaceae bacterium]
MLQLDSITKSYTTGDFTQQALAGVSIAFRDNEFVAILGPSGSGKTTLLNIIGGLDQYDSGDLIIDGVSTKQYKDRDWDTYRNNRVGFVFQSYNLIPHQSVLANVELALTLSGVSPAERKERALKALEEVGLKDHANKRPNQLSGGQAQRVAIARALVNNPTIVLADEPTGALDSKTSVDVMNLLTEIARDRLVVMVTHNPDLADTYANRIVNLADGQIVGDTNPFDPATEPAPEPKPVRRTAMSFFTALSLSAQNLWTKKGRTIMTAFAGSIGIIGIALILALATSANNYIHSVEEETLSEYPLTITRSGFSISAMMGGTPTESSTADDSGSEAAGGEEAEPAPTRPDDSVRVAKMLTTMVRGIGSNDLISLKAFLDANGGNIHDYARSIEYTYGITPLLFARNPAGNWQQVNPDTAVSDYTTSSLSSSYFSSLMSSDIFYCLPELPALYENDYEMVTGRWPERYDELVLVLTGSGAISDIMLYNLGLKDVAEAKALIDAIMNGENAEVSTSAGAYTYEDLLGLSFKLVNVADTYEYAELYGVWKAKADDPAFMEGIIERGDTVRIVGLVKPDPDAK